MSDRRARLLEAVREAREMCEAALPAPWKAGIPLRQCKMQHEGYSGHGRGECSYDLQSWIDESGYLFSVGENSEELIIQPDESGDSAPQATIAFISRSRTLLPALLAVAEAQIGEHECEPEWRESERGDFELTPELRCAGGCEMPYSRCPVLASWCAAFGVEE